MQQVKQINNLRIFNIKTSYGTGFIVKNPSGKCVYSATDYSVVEAWCRNCFDYVKVKTTTYKNPQTHDIMVKKKLSTVKDRKKEPDMKTITFKGRQYECKRYSSEELHKMFHGYAVALENTKIKDMNLVSGVLVDVFDSDDRNIMREKYMIEGLEYSVWDLSPQPILVGLG